MSTLSPAEQEIFDVAKESIPRFFFQKQGAPQEIFAAAAKAFGLARSQIDAWLSETLIGQADGFWLDQHAIDRGTRRQANETDPPLASRIRSVEDAVTLPALEAASTTVLSAAAGADVGADIVELRAHKGFFANLRMKIQAIDPALLADGEAFSIRDGVTTRVFEFDKNGSIVGGHVSVNISASTTVAHVVAALVTAINGLGNLLAVVNPFDATQVVVFSSTPNVSVTLVSETVINPAFLISEGKNAAFASRGYRFGSLPPRNALIVILPYGTSAGAAQAVGDMLRQKKGGGIIVHVETRRIP